MATKKKKPAPKFKVMYKRFNVDVTGRLRPPIASAGDYFNAGGTPLTVNNAEGFTAAPVKGRLNMCSNGYHAAPKYATRWIFFNGTHRIYKVRLIQPKTRKSDYAYYRRTFGRRQANNYEKWVGRSFKILHEVDSRFQRK